MVRKCGIYMNGEVADAIENCCILCKKKIQSFIKQGLSFYNFMRIKCSRFHFEFILFLVVYMKLEDIIWGLHFCFKKLIKTL